MFGKTHGNDDESTDEETRQRRRDRKNKKARERREKKNLARSRPKLPKNKIVVIKNKDKGSWVESWDKPKNRDIGLFPHPTRAIFTGNTGMGKSLSMLNCMLRVQGSPRPFKEVHIVCCDIGSKEWDDIEPTTKRETLPEISEFDGKKKVLLIIDDWDTTKISKQQQQLLSKWFRYGSTHLNASIYMSYQSCFHVPSIARRCSNVWHVWRPTSDTELRMIGERAGIKPEDITEIFDTICTHFRDFLTVDLTVNSPAKLRKNIFQVIELRGDDSDSE